MGKFAAKGVVFGIEIAAAPGTYTPCANVRNVSGPSLALDPVEISCHSSPGFYREFVAGFADPGEITLELVWDPNEITHDLGTDGLLDIFNRQVVSSFQIIWPDAPNNTEWDFLGIVSAYSPEAPFDDMLAASVTIKLSGAPAFPAHVP